MSDKESFPRIVYHPSHGAVRVDSLAELKDLGDGWEDTYACLSDQKSEALNTKPYASVVGKIVALGGRPPVKPVEPVEKAKEFETTESLMKESIFDLRKMARERGRPVGPRSTKETIVAKLLGTK